MKTFLTYVDESYGHPLSPHFSQGGSSTGPGMGQYMPVANLNAADEKEIKKSDLDQIEKYADRIFASLNIDVEFTRHFLDRVNDKRNVKQITSAELTRLFKQSYKKYGKKIAQLGPDAEAVISDMKTDEVNDTTGHIHINTITRKYSGGDDYIDSTSSEPLPIELVK